MLRCRSKPGMASGGMGDVLSGVLGGLIAQGLSLSEAARLGVLRGPIDAATIVERCLFALIIEGEALLESGTASSAADIDVVWTSGYGFPRHRGGPMHYAGTFGAAALLERIESLARVHGERYWQAPQRLRAAAAAATAAAATAAITTHVPT